MLKVEHSVKKLFQDRKEKMSPGNNLTNIVEPSLIMLRTNITEF